MRTATIITGVTLASALALAAGPARAARPDCEPARCAVQAAIAAECPCAESANHGRHVSCVAHVVKRLSAQGVVPTNCKGKVTRCAARSTCGKPGFVTCHVPTDRCDTTTGFCVENPALACLIDFDCGSRCTVKSSLDGCVARGGIIGTESSCCATCQ